MRWILNIHDQLFACPQSFHCVNISFSRTRPLSLSPLLLTPSTEWCVNSLDSWEVSLPPCWLSIPSWVKISFNVVNTFSIVKSLACNKMHLCRKWTKKIQSYIRHTSLRTFKLLFSLRADTSLADSSGSCKKSGNKRHLHDCSVICSQPKWRLKLKTVPELSSQRE